MLEFCKSKCTASKEVNCYGNVCLMSKYNKQSLENSILKQTHRIDCCIFVAVA